MDARRSVNQIKNRTHTEIKIKIYYTHEFDEMKRAHAELERNTTKYTENELVGAKRKMCVYIPGPD